MSVQFTKTALSWCLGKGSISFRGGRRRPWLEIQRPETERSYLSYQLFSLRRSHDGPYNDVRDVVSGDGFYDDERIRFTGEGLYAAYELLYPRDVKTISQQVMDLTGVMGLTALWMDCGKINNSKSGRLRGRFNAEAASAIKQALLRYDIPSRINAGVTNGRVVTLNQEAMLKLARLIRPYAHYSTKAKLQLRKSPPGSGQTRSQPTDREANALLRRVG